jgi:hypothetical protein
MIRCVRIWTAEDGNSRFEEGAIDMPKGERGYVLNGLAATTSISFRETRAGGTFEWHDAPAPQFATRTIRAATAEVLRVDNIRSERLPRRPHTDAVTMCGRVSLGAARASA